MQLNDESNQKIMLAIVSTISALDCSRFARQTNKPFGYYKKSIEVAEWIQDESRYGDDAIVHV